MQLTDTWMVRINSNQELLKRGQWVNLTFTFGIENTDYLFEIINGKVNSINKRVLLTKSGVFRIHGQSVSWEKHWLKNPPRDYHDIFAMLAKKIIILEGDLTPFIQNLQYFKDLIASNRTFND
ncbi:hypothetical protein ABXT66_01615 [Candidatus Levibacter sp. Uisw_134_01]|uniref:hypothetical protein n=1 Tax=Candidatus Levibacter sp. Uisw_134_01 TaxID=3230999 RepID=UPI003D38B1AE